MEPFDYPDSPLVRRHGPIGYASPDSFRPWLRDEFAFRCVFCRCREAWSLVHGLYDIDHFQPVVHHPELSTEYDNLLYACATCNNIKRDRDVLDPLMFFTASQVGLQSDGALIGKTTEASQLIDVFRLNSQRAREFRKMWMDIVRIVKENDLDLYRRLMGFPKELPDLKRLKPPGGNSRPDGVEQCYFEQRERGELPGTY